MFLFFDLEGPGRWKGWASNSENKWEKTIWENSLEIHVLLGLFRGRLGDIICKLLQYTSVDIGSDLVTLSECAEFTNERSAFRSWSSFREPGEQQTHMNSLVEENVSVVLERKSKRMLCIVQAYKPIQYGWENAVMLESLKNSRPTWTIWLKRTLNRV